MIAWTNSKRMVHWMLLVLAVVLGVTSQSILASAEQQENTNDPSKLAIQDEAQSVPPREQVLKNLLAQLRELERLRKLLLQRFGTREIGELDGNSVGTDAAQDLWDMPNEALEKRDWHKRRQWLWTPGSGYQQLSDTREDSSSKGNHPIRYG